MDIVQVLAQYGFPAVIAGFLVYHTVKQFSELTDRIERNTRALMALVTVMAKAHGVDVNEVHTLVGNGRA